VGRLSYRPQAALGERVNTMPESVLAPGPASKMPQRPSGWCAAWAAAPKGQQVGGCGGRLAVPAGGGSPRFLVEVEQAARRLKVLQPEDTELVE